MLKNKFEKLVLSLTGDSTNSQLLPSEPLNKIHIFLIPLLIVVSSMLVKITGIYYVDSDQFWSLAVGQWIAEHGAVPVVDTFSWTIEGKPWQSNSWLFCWLLYQIDYYWGMYGVAVMIAAVYYVTALFIYAMSHKLNQSRITVWIFAVGMWSLIYLSATPRAYIFTFIFVAAILYLVRFHRDTRLIYLVPLIFLLWVNVQTSVRFGIALLMVEALVGTFFYKDKRLWSILVLSFLATLANPYGTSIWGISILGIATPGVQYISEWQAPNFNNTSILLRYLIPAITGVVASYGVVFSAREKNAIDRDQLMIFFWFWAMFLYALTMARASNYMMLLWIPYFAAFAPRWLTTRFRIKPYILSGILVLFTLSILIILPRLPLFRAPEATVPVGALRYLQEHPEVQENIFNDYIFGGFLLANDIKVFIDARESPYTREGVTADYMALINLRATPNRIIDKYEIKNFVIRTNRPLTFFLDESPDWELVYIDRTAVIFTKAE